MNKIEWRTLSAAELSQLLQQADIQESRAVGAATVYRLGMPGCELMAVSLADGQALVMEPKSWPSANRRSRGRPETGQ